MESFFTELKRRNVFKVGVAYTIVAWIIIQVAATTFPALHLPPWAITLVTVFIIIGFPLILLFTWAFELTPDGLKRTRHVETDESITHITGQKINVGIITLLSIAVIFLVLDNYVLKGFGNQEVGISSEGKESPLIEKPSVEVSEQITVTTTPNTFEDKTQSIAVLPFSDMSAEGDQEWFGDGIAEELLNALAKIKQLRVAGRTSSFSFKDKDVTISEIAKTLGVSTIMEGSIRKSGNRVRITAQLINAADGYHIWSETYDRELTDIFAIQDDISRAVVNALKVEMGLPADTSLINPGTTNLEAYQWYLKGLNEFAYLTFSNIKEAINSFRRASELDPVFVKAQGSLSIALALSALFDDYNKWAPQAREVFTRALELDPDQSEALAAKAVYVAFTDWDWKESVQLYRKAKVSGTISYMVSVLPSNIMTPVGLREEANRSLKAAEINDPANPLLINVLALHQIIDGNILLAISTAEGGLRFHPDNPFLLVKLFLAHFILGNIEEMKSAQARLEQVTDHNSPHVLWSRGLVYLADGKRAKAEETQRTMIEFARNRSGYSYHLAWLTAELGDIEGSLDWLEDAYKRRDFYISWIRTNYFASNSGIRQHPRFRAILKAMRLDDASLREMGFLE